MLKDGTPESILPSVDQCMKRPGIEAVALECGRALVLDAVRTVIAEIRNALRSDQAEPLADHAQTAEVIERAVFAKLAREKNPPLRRVFNLTGTVLHTNLGRAPLAAEAIAAVIEAAGACDLEYELEKGERGERDDHVSGWLTKNSGAETALVVNNNAAAVLLALNSLAKGREVIVSRGELIEIGGAFRMPDIMARAGCKLVEVGTTNRTHLADYADAIGPKTAALMRVHPSNYAIAGFVSSVEERKIAELAHERGLHFIVDLGSGSLIDLSRFGLPKEPTVRQVVAQGADLVTFSGDKLLGGPQAGLVVGRKDLVAKLKKNPLKRALRLDKLTLAALGATLKLYDDPDRLAQRLPSLRLLARSQGDIRAQAERLLPPVQAQLAGVAEVEIAACVSQIGSGSLPVDRLQSWALAIRPAQARRGAGKRLANLGAAFRAVPTAVIGRFQDGALKFDLRCLEDEDEFLKQVAAVEIVP